MSTRVIASGAVAWSRMRTLWSMSSNFATSGKACTIAVRSAWSAR